MFGTLAVILLGFLFRDFTNCMLLEISSFRALEEDRRGVILPDTELGIEGSEGMPFHSTITFRAGDFHASYTDTFQTAHYSCEGGMVIIDDPFYGSHTVHCDPLIGTLLWGGRTYQNTGQLIRVLAAVILSILIMETFRLGWL